MLGEHFAKWYVDSIAGVEVGVEQYKSDESIGWEHFIRVQPDHNKPRQWFSNRTKAELEWIATTVGDHLGRLGADQRR